MGIIAWILLGLIAGLIATAIHKGQEPRGVPTFAVGIIGALLGGLIASAAGIGSIGTFFTLGTWIIAIGGALLFLLLFDTLAGRRGTPHRA